jgi:hypothetical protein
LPTVPELPAMRLPPEIIAAADALMKSQVDAMRAPTREMPAAQVEAAAQSMVELQPALAVDPIPELNLAAPARPSEPVAVHSHTLDEESPAELDVVRIPTMEIKAIAAETAALGLVAPTPLVVQPSIALSDSISVSADLAADGAMMLSDDELAAIQANSRRVWLVFGGIAGAALALIAVVVMLATRPVAVPAAVAPMKAVEVAAPAPAPKVIDELEPLPRITPRPGKARVAREPSVAVEMAPAEAKTEEPSRLNDFGFLESAEAPKSELKRPSSEL